MSVNVPCLRIVGLRYPTVIMTAIKTYSLRLDADLAKLKLDAAGLPSIIVGVDVTMQGGAGGVKLLVPDEHIEAALKALDQP